MCALISTLGSDPSDSNLIPKPTLRQFYPPLKPHKHGYLKVDEQHELYWEMCGNPQGSPVVYLHGGPGSGCASDQRRFFDPSHYCVYLFDQRGSGKSRPSACLDNNTTQHLISDIEKLRNHLVVSSWHIFGGSWGSTLSLAYSQAHPTSVKSIIMWGIFTLSRSEIAWHSPQGAGQIFPERFEEYNNFIPVEEQDDLEMAYYKRLASDDMKIALPAAKHWSRYEMGTARLYPAASLDRADDDVQWALNIARIEAHYHINRGFMTEGQLLKKENIDKIRHIPAIILNGRYDICCPPKTAYELHKQWPEADFHIIPDSGHSARDVALLSKLIESSDKMRSIK